MGRRVELSGEEEVGRREGFGRGAEMGQVIGPVSTCRCSSFRFLKIGAGSSVLENLLSC